MPKKPGVENKPPSPEVENSGTAVYFEKTKPSGENNLAQVHPEALKRKRGRPPKVLPVSLVKGETGKAEKEEAALKDKWEAAGNSQAALINTATPALPQDLSLAAGVSLFLRTLKGQSAQTHKSYRVGCRVFMLFLFDSGRGEPSATRVLDLPPLILEDYYLWLVDKYSRAKKMTVSGYMAGPRNLFSYLARRDITPGGVQYSKMVGGLSKLVGRASYKTPRVDYNDTRKLAEFMYRLKIPSLVELSEGGGAFTGENSSPISNPAGEGTEKSPGNLNPLANLYQSRRKLSAKEIIQRRQEILRDRAIILTLYTTGMRREEVSSLNRADVRDEEVIITGKGEKERVVFFDEPTLLAIREYLTARNDVYQPLFIQHGVNRGKPKAGGVNLRLSPFSIWAVVQKWAGVMGIKVNPHDFRHSLATSMLNNGAQLSEVQDLLGHASPVTTKMIYAHYERKTLRAAIARHRVGINTLNSQSGSLPES